MSLKHTFTHIQIVLDMSIIKKINKLMILHQDIIIIINQNSNNIIIMSEKNELDTRNIIRNINIIKIVIIMFQFKYTSV